MTTDASGTPPTSDAETLAEKTVDITGLLAEAAKKSDILWVDVPGERSFAVWHAWETDRFYLVSGEGEQLLPPLPEVVSLILRSKDSGGRLITVQATAHLLPPHSDSWESAVAALSAERLNTTDDAPARWAESGSVYALHPFGEPLTPVTGDGAESGSAPLLPAPATTVGWRPWHAGRS